MFDNPESWVLISNSTKNATLVGDLIIQPIAAFEPNHLFTSSTIGVQAVSVSAKDSWVKAGYLSQFFVDTPLGLTGMAQGERFFIPLVVPIILKMSKFPTNYKISFQPPKYFKDCSFTVWEFKGEI
ncbi:hypothetical protein [Mastigocladopsis repens]|uniref:hypothetical protein n=1 Tax=Mastigocladopsis repens TaxID=221287 RepID=UPI0002FCC461|nr:hypothetical protein [Mastigocladopsis repens]